MYNPQNSLFFLQSNMMNTYTPLPVNNFLPFPSSNMFNNGLQQGIHPQIYYNFLQEKVLTEMRNESMNQNYLLYKNAGSPQSFCNMSETTSVGSYSPPQVPREILKVSNQKFLEAQSKLFGSNKPQEKKHSTKVEHIETKKEDLPIKVEATRNENQKEICPKQITMSSLLNNGTTLNKEIPAITKENEVSIKIEVNIQEDEEELADKQSSILNKKISKPQVSQRPVKPLPITAPQSSRNLWKPHEDKLVVELIAKHGQKWAKIAKLVEGRTGKQIRDRYLNKLRPDINSGEWTPSEDKLYVELYKVLGKRWKEIANRLPGRTEFQVKNHYYMNLRNILD